MFFGTNNKQKKYDHTTVQKKIMKIQIASDVHLEMNSQCFDTSLDYADIVEPCAPCLALLGDIGIPLYSKDESNKDHYHHFLSSMSSKFEHVFIVAGNHEFYGSEYYAVKEECARICKQFHNVIFMDRTSYLYENPSDPSDKVRILGCTLWSHVPSDKAELVGKMLNDYRVIQIRTSEDASGIDTSTNSRRITVDDTNEWHREDVEFLREEIRKATLNNENILVLTHHAPSFYKTSSPQHDQSPIKTAFCTDLESLMTRNVKCWIFGHTHFCTDYTMEKTGTRVVSNQLGYRLLKEKVDYKQSLAINVPMLPTSREKNSACNLL